MRKFGFLFLLFLLLGCAIHGQTSLSISPSPVSPGYFGTMTITGVNTNFDIATRGISLTLQHVNTGQTYDFGVQPGMFHATWDTTTNDLLTSGYVSLPMNAPLGFYNGTLVGYGDGGSNMYVTQNNLLTVLGNGAYYMGKVVYDRDSNCTQNGGDFGVANQLVTASPGGYTCMTDANGNFVTILPVGTYTFSTTHPNGSTLVCPASPFTQQATTAAIGDTASGIDFYAKPDHLADLEPTIFNGHHRPGFTTNYFHLFLENQSLEPALNCVAQLVKPAGFTFSSFVVTPTTINGDTATWNIGTVAPLSTVTFLGRAAVPANVPIGTPYTYQAFATTSTAESNTLNNTTSRLDTVCGSFDPNDKQVRDDNGDNADGFILPGNTTLRYLIRFQNTGTDTAFNISIADVIDPNLDATTLKVNAASAAYQIEYLDSLGHNLRFNFDNIMLPDSHVNEAASHGFIDYSIDQNPGLAQGVTISNRADIYFDFNQPVLTNTVHSKICEALGTQFTSSVNGMQVSFVAPPAGNPDNWSWDFGDGNSSTLEMPTHTYASNGAYTVCLALENACGRTKTICANMYIGVSGTGNLQEALRSLTLAPNPAHDQVELQIDAERLHGVALTLRDLQGKAVEQWNVNAIFGKYVKQLPVGHLAPGLYFLNLQSLEAQYTVKLMVE